MRHTGMMFGVLLVLTVPIAVAQETTGDIEGMVIDSDGLALPDVVVQVSNLETGFERSAVTTAQGRFRLPALSPSNYELSATRDGFRTYRIPVSVQVGHTLRLQIPMAVGVFSDVLEVVGTRPSLNARSTVSGLTVSVDDLMDNAPIKREVTRIALLAPGSFAAPQYWQEPNVSEGLHTPGQAYASMRGATIGENAYVVNGLNINNFRYGLGASYVPIVFLDEVQVKTGGYEAEFGRATGGVINMVTKSGTNIFRGGLSLYLEPEQLQENEPDTALIDNHRERRETLEANGWLGGPIVRDKLFFFAFLQYTDSSVLNNYKVWFGEERSAWRTPYWGGKIDWISGSAHRLEGTYFSDAATVDFSAFDYNPLSGEAAGPVGNGSRYAGGDNFVLRYTGVLRDNLLLSMAAGSNEFERSKRTDGDECPYVIDDRDGYNPNPGCWSSGWLYPNDSDLRRAYRVDLDWFVGNHSLRFGLDHERNESRASFEYSGGAQYVYRLNGSEGGDPNDFIDSRYPWDQDIAFVYQKTSDGVFDTNSSAFYVQDSWTIRPNLTFNFGIRWEGFENKNALGQTFIETNDQWAPRLGVIWDPGSDGRSKVYASASVYHWPVESRYNIYLASATYDTERWYVFDGELDDYGQPLELGERINNNVRADGSPPDPREVLSENFDPMARYEVSVGFERMLGQNWTVGIRGVAQRLDQVLEDYAIDLGLYQHYGVECANPALTGSDEHCGFEMRLGNPGADYSGWYDLDGDGELDRIFIPADALEIPAVDLTSYSVELTFARRFADRWMLNGNYTWSHTYGNYGGVIDSDWIIGPLRGTSWFFDSGTLMENSYGDLPQDRRHNLKVFGQYAFDFGMQVGLGFYYLTGLPINSFGRHPSDPFAQSYYNPNTFSTVPFFTNGEPRPRGCCGRTEDLWNVDLMLNYSFRGLGGEWFVRLDVFNVSNNSAPAMVWDSAEFSFGLPHPYYGETMAHQRPRTVRFGLGWSF